MILGMSVATFTLVHTLISLVAIGSGLVVLFAMIGGKRLGGWTGFFLTTTLLTTVTGYFFPFSFDHLLPSHKVGFVSLVLLAIAIPALYMFHLAGGWRKTYVITAVMALYLNVFVLVEATRDPVLDQGPSESSTGSLASLGMTGERLRNKMAERTGFEPVVEV